MEAEQQVEEILPQEQKPIPKYKVLRGHHSDGKPMFIKVDPMLQKTLNLAINRVTKKNWDYVSIVAGLPGAGKSTFAQGAARFCCPWFNERYIAFTDEDFIRITNEAEEFSSVILDESFQSLNSKITMSTAFLKIINHLQIIRQKHLFVFLCLPNFFDLSKGVAVFRASHLFVTYPDEEGNRGRFLAFDRDKKRELYIRGNKFMDYNAVKSNYFARFYENEIVPLKIYEAMKLRHLKMQGPLRGAPIRHVMMRDNLINHLKHELSHTTTQISELTGLSLRQVQDIVKTGAKNAEISVPKLL